MRKVIDGRAYDTATAEKIADVGNNEPKDDFWWDRTALYRTHNGRFFIAGESGGCGRWRERIPSGYVDGSGLRAITEDEARQLVEQHANHRFEDVFGAVEEA